MILMMSFTLGLGACSYRNLVDAPADNNSDPKLSEKISPRELSYANIRDQILTPKCVGCHGVDDKFPLTSYAEVKAATADIRRLVLTKKKMPPRKPLASRDQELLKEWLDADCPELAPVEPDPSPSASGSPLASTPLLRPVTYAVFRDKVIQPSCVSCHYPANDKGLTDLTDLNVIKANIGTLVFVTIVNPQMPVPPVLLTREQKDIVSGWVVDGMQ
jgi:hypothetical protein